MQFFALLEKIFKFQLESERQTYVKQMDTQIKAKNEIIGDLKAANETLQSHLKRLQVTAANDPLHTAMVGGTQVCVDCFK